MLWPSAGFAGNEAASVKPLRPSAAFLMNSLRVIPLTIGSLLCFCFTKIDSFDGSFDSLISTAATKAGHFTVDVVIGGIGILFEKRICIQYLAGLAVPALAHLFGDPSVLDGLSQDIIQSFYGYDIPLADSSDPNHA